MKITLATHIVVEQVGQQMFLLDSQNKQVYTLPTEGVAHYAPETQTMIVTPALVPEAQKLVDAGVATLPGMVSRRAVVGSTGVFIGGGLVAMSMPSLAAASSGPTPFTGEWIFGSAQNALEKLEFILLFSLEDVTPLQDADPTIPWTVQLFGRSFDVFFEESIYYGTGFFFDLAGPEDVGVPGENFFDFWLAVSNAGPKSAFVATVTAGDITVQILFEPMVPGSI